ncbi:MAG: hypothetical protein PHH85_03815 [Candidatus Methanoperedens sp.]|nr:hypothetical protein [Candidatus Methanoperedens sp.]
MDSLEKGRLDMTDGKSKFKILMETLLEASKSKEWDVAKKEWKMTKIYFVDPESTSGESFYETCSCSHYPIKEVITIKNTLNKNELTLGNCCITKIIEDKKENKRHKAIFNALKYKKINKELIEQAYYNDHFINQWEFEFLLKTFRKRSRSEKQDNVFIRIKDTIMRLYGSKYNAKMDGL